jgi:hypothetical protein
MAVMAILGDQSVVVEALAVLALPIIFLCLLAAKTIAMVRNHMLFPLLVSISSRSAVLKERRCVQVS